MSYRPGTLHHARPLGPPPAGAIHTMQPVQHERRGRQLQERLGCAPARSGPVRGEAHMPSDERLAAARRRPLRGDPQVPAGHLHVRRADDDHIDDAAYEQHGT